MTHIILKAALSVACIAGLSACDRSNSAINNPGGVIGAGNGIGTGGVNDPNSVAYFQQTIGDRVLFVVNQSGLTPEAISILDGQANWLAQNPQYNITVEGHADEQGTREYNLALGARRASSAQNYLVSKGVADTRIKTITYGKERPIEICSTESCWSQNRRAVTVVAGGLGS